jgi:hypothetical protein
MHYDDLSMDLYLRDGCGGVVKINCTQACPTMTPKEMVEYLASRFGQTVIWRDDVKMVDASPEDGAEEVTADSVPPDTDQTLPENADDVEPADGASVAEMPADDPPQEAEGMEQAATEEFDEEVLPKKAKKVIHLDRAPDEMFEKLTCSMGGDD